MYVLGDPTTCGFIRLELQYDADVSEAKQHMLQTAMEASVGSYAELKEELEEVKQTVDSVVVELWKLKVKPAEPKPEVDTRKCQVVLDCSALSTIVVVFVGVFIGVVVARLWK